MLAQLEAILSIPLTLVAAGSGWGKSTLLSLWAMLHSGQVAWLSLDPDDNDPLGFWTLIIAALRTCFPRLERKALAKLYTDPSPALSTILMDLLSEVEQHPEGMVLILDNFHRVSDQSILAGIRFWLSHLPANMHLVLTTRTDPDLPLASFRARGQLLEIRDAELALTREEAAHFLLERMGLTLSFEEASLLHRRTEGWMAGLQLAALSARKQKDPSAWIRQFSGSHRHLMDYVQQDILASLPVTLQEFALHTSILTHLNASICQAVTQVSTLKECQQRLQELEQANLFVVPLDEYRQEYRYRELFRESLFQLLQVEQPSLVPLLHQRAAHWYEKERRWHEAISHAMVEPANPFQEQQRYLLTQPQTMPAPEALTRREQEILCLLAQGATNQEIARALVIELSTVKKHVSNLLNKLGVSRRSQAIARARTLSLL
jgi:LuxR family maltose regulon positive regulatory protein